jgi:hypothetical protein
MRRFFPWLVLVASILLALYVSTFTYWWVRSPSSVFIDNGKRVHLVEFKWSKAYLQTEELWIPAFWFMTHVLGYEKAGSILMFENSIILYAKREH